MIKGKRVLAYIPARSGSKSIIDKNIVDVCGKPLIAYSIEAAKASKYVDKIMMSTDSAKYAEIAIKYGAEAPFLRPPELAGDNSSEMDACLHLLKWIEQNTKERFDIVVKFEPTSPLRIAQDVDKAIEKLVEKNADTVVSVTEAITHPFWMNTLPSDHSMKGFIKPDVAKKNRQELPVYYQLDGVMYVARVDFVKKHRTWFSDDNGYATITPNERSIDIDGQIQLELVRLLIKKRMKQGHD
jgi:CMP-N,N'-diacetyllegionaminic acid synthase